MQTRVTVRHRLTHHCESFEMNSESVRFRESMKEQ